MREAPNNHDRVTARSRDACRRLGEAALIRFLRAQQSQNGHAIDFLLEALDKGQSFDALLEPDADGCLFHVYLQQQTAHWRLRFGCYAGPEAGDGCAWDIKLSPEGDIRALGPGSHWIA